MTTTNKKHNSKMLIALKKSNTLIFSILLLYVACSCNSKRWIGANEETEMPLDSFPKNINCLEIENRLLLDTLHEPNFDNQSMGLYFFPVDSQLVDFDTIRVNSEYDINFYVGKYLNAKADTLEIANRKYPTDILFPNASKNYNNEAVKTFYSSPIYKYQKGDWSYLILQGGQRTQNRTTNNYWVVAIFNKNNFDTLYTFNDASFGVDPFRDFNNDQKLDYMRHQNGNADPFKNPNLDWKFEEDTIFIYTFKANKVERLPDYLIMLPNGKNRSAWWMQTFDSIDWKRSNFSLKWKKKDCLPHDQY